MLNRIEGESSDAVLVNAASATDPWQLIRAIATRANVPREISSEIAAPFQQVDPLTVPRVLRDIRTALQAENRRVTVLVDGPMPPGVANQLFGRLRDDLFVLPMTWLVVGHDERIAEYLTPPADVFFEAVERIDDLDGAGVERLLELRGAASLLKRGGGRLKLAHDGTPRQVLALARAIQLQDGDGTVESMQRYADATAQLSRGASMVLSELHGRGPVSATDPDLMLRLGVTDRHLRRSFRELEAAGLVETIPGSRNGSGRPATTFRLTPLGAHPEPNVR